MKIAVYVEGQTELIFVRELLLKWHDYNSSLIGFRCYNLRNADAPGHPTDYSFGNFQSTNFYEIVNVGTDTSVLSMAIKNAPRYKNVGYDRIVALRDMFSDKYHAESYKLSGSRIIHPELNDLFINGAEKSIAEKGCDRFVRINFAIMEVEAWLLGMAWYLEKEDHILTQEFLLNTHNIDIDNDPETNSYHPADELKKIYRSIGKDYDKHNGDVCSIMSKLDKADFEMLFTLPKCDSFNRFLLNLVN